MTRSQQPHPQRDLCPLCKGEGYVLSASHSSATPAQERIDAVVQYCNQRHFEVEDDDGTTYEVIPKGEIIALLQAGRK